MSLARRILLALFCAAVLPLTACHRESGGAWNGTDVSGSMPSLSFDLTRASDGRPVSAADYRGKTVLLYFGYTFCPDVCPFTLNNLGEALRKMDPKAAANVRVLFVTVDPARDTLPVLKRYAEAFGPKFVGLRGSQNELATLAKRYRIAYSVHADPDPQKYEVTHSSSIYVFDGTGEARLLFTKLSTPNPDIKGATADLDRLAGDKVGA